MKTTHLLAAATVVHVTSLLFASVAFAGPLTDHTAGAKLFLGADVWSTPSNVPDNGGIAAGPDLGFRGNAGGFSYGLAGYYELRIIKLIGVEADVAYQHGQFHRNVTWNDVKYTEELTINSWRLPILAKLNIPLPLGRIWVGLGPEFTISSSSSYSVTGGATGGRTQDKKPTYGTGGFGLVFEMPLTGIEIPVEFRASKNLSQPDSWMDRVDVNQGIIKAESSWVYRLGVGIGFSF